MTVYVYSSKKVPVGSHSLMNFKDFKGAKIDAELVYIDGGESEHGAYVNDEAESVRQAYSIIGVVVKDYSELS